MNYDKWNSVDSNCSEQENILEATAEYDPIQLKTAADIVFHRAEEHSSALDGNKEPYHQCIQMYSRVIDAADTGYATNTDTLGCLLYIACCFVRIGQWQRAENSCRKTLKYVDKHDWKVQLRAAYFITYSLLKQATEAADSGSIQDLLLHASKEAMLLNDLIVSHEQHIEAKDMQEYVSLMRQLQETKSIAIDSAQHRDKQHFETAVQAQAAGHALQAAEGLVRCATELQASSTAVDDTTVLDVTARILIQAGVIYVQSRMWVQALSCFEKALQHCSRNSLLCGVTHYYISLCVRHNSPVSHAVSTVAVARQQGDQAEAHLVIAVNVLELCVFQQCDDVICDTDNMHFAVHLLSKQAHMITNAALLSDTTTVLVARSSCILALYQHLFRAYDALADHLASCTEYDLCNLVTDRTIDASSALIAQVTINTSKSTTSNNGEAHGTGREILDMLLTRRAQCFVAKAMLYKDHIILCARISGAKPYTGRVFTWTVALPNAVHTKHSNNSNVLQVNRYSTVHKMEFENASEAVAVFLQIAGEEYEPLNLAESIQTFHILATYTMEQAAIEPFQLDNNNEIKATQEVNKKDLAEKAAEAFKKVSLLASQKISVIDKTIATPLPAPSTVPFPTVPVCTDGARSDPAALEDKRLLALHNDKYFHLQQSMLALYNAGVCAFRCDNTLAQRHLESAECVRKDIDILLASKLQKQYDFDSLLAAATEPCTTMGANGEDDSGHDESKNKASAALQDRSLHGYYAASGDLAFHLSHAYLRLSNYTEALQEACAAVHFYEHSERLFFALNCLSTDSARTTAKMSKQHRALLQKGVGELVIPLREMTPAGRLRQRQAQGLVALCNSACGEDKKAEQALRNVADLCLGPIEDAERETRAVRRTISQHQSTVLDQLRADRDTADAATATTPTPAAMNTTPATAAKPSAAVPGTSLNMRLESIEASPETRKFDFNLLIAYSILVGVSAIIVSRFVSFW